MSGDGENKSDNENVGEKRKVLVIGSSWDRFQGSFLGDTNLWTYELCPDMMAAMLKMTSGDYDAVLIEQGFFSRFYDRAQFSQEKSILENLPVGLVLVDYDQKILWHNRQFQEWCDVDTTNGQKFYVPLGRPEMRGPDFCPFRSIRLHGKQTTTVMYQPEFERYLQMTAGPVFNENGEIFNYTVELRDVTDQTVKEIKLERLREAGKELADISKKDLSAYTSEERVEFLRLKIVKYAKEILQFDTVEIRILSDKIPKRLDPLLAIGMTEEAEQRELYAYQENNGITGWVAFHGKSYRMDNPTEDHFYLPGLPDAKSSITAPLLHQGKVIGTFNVESQRVKAFSDYDLRLLEGFARDVAQAIHTLELLSYEEKDSAYRSIESVYSDSVKPLNQILNECARMQQGRLENREDVFNAFSRIQHLTREIQSIFQVHGAEIAPELPQEISATDCVKYPMLRNRRLLMVDMDESVGRELSRILFYYGCTVETASSGENALKMLDTAFYDAILSDIKLSDMSAFDFFVRVRCALCHTDNEVHGGCAPTSDQLVCDSDKVSFVPFIYMRAFGYDTGHVTSRARQAGVIGFIFKPFILPQLLDTLKLVISTAEEDRKRRGV